ncbi:Exonuclease SbcC [Actinacidiphila bryophytorum]|uniref:Exonuclease SbcC n=1 Tax=Actinacidiphila bryophytorum TaxID=1436133 RepID=A0A9W4E168_9ACTN|nr:Exonuclease SbcC [Actinacidiphila bryophytorum]
MRTERREERRSSTRCAGGARAPSRFCGVAGGGAPPRKTSRSSQRHPGGASSLVRFGAHGQLRVHKCPENRRRTPDGPRGGPCDGPWKGQSRAPWA